MALLNEAAGRHLGWITPTLYANTSGRAFRDISAGSNAIPAIPPQVATRGYNAAVGWDACAGLGSPVGTVLRTLFAPPHWGAGWEDLGGAITGPLSAVSWAANRLDIFGVGAGGHVQHMWYDPTLPHTVHGWGAGWEDLGGAITGPLSAVSWAANRLDIFGVTAGHTVQHQWFG
jgi:hypothetical protein